ncbi:acyl-CoA N-acyltransferase [Rhexocercosporidium sp. MPI-PUGE-AT-0058]|nr:acyl-CoA N-acyltransferase [Rhexocercosporidium sp. MPI-PUGE-AT-0058]
MSTEPPPKILFQPPVPLSLLETYKLHLPSTSQSPLIPQTFLDSLTVRATVFVHEQNAVPRHHHIDRDDARSCCMVLYIPEPGTGDGSRPVGTIRLVPSPHYPHPSQGARYEAPGDDVPAVSARELFSAPLRGYIIDRATDLHDGVEPYVKLGRLCVVKEFRGRGYAVWLVQGMLQWLVANPDFVCAGNGAGRKWKGLVGIHANADAVGTWRKCGFVVDEGMGTWFEGGMKHVGMFLRLHLDGVDRK